MANIANKVVFDAIIEKMEKGIIPWKKKWSEFRPCNGLSNRKYHGINFFLLSMAEYEDPRWMTFKQVTEMGGQVRKGEKAKQIVFWTILRKEEEGKSFPLLKYFSVFNAMQCDGLKLKPLVKEVLPTAEELISRLQNLPQIKHGFSQASYNPRTDVISMPNRSQFTDISEYYSTFFHEIIHSTGAKDRLDRKGVTNFDTFDTTQYSEEELIAEWGSAILCSMAGIDNTMDNTAAYLQGWMRVFKEKPEMLVYAASRAQKAVDYLLGVTSEDN